MRITRLFQLQRQHWPPIIMAAALLSVLAAAALAANTSLAQTGADMLEDSNPDATLGTLRPNLPQPEPAQEVFSLTLQQLSDNHLVLLWDIADGYYLYRKSIGLEGGKASLVIPEGTLIEDEFFGEVAIFHNSLEVHVLLEPEQDIDTFVVNYQGCAEDTYCYPMQFEALEI